jgi:uncharacterized membrane protein
MRNVDMGVSVKSPIHQRMTLLLRLLTMVAGMVILLGGILLLVRRGYAVTRFHTFAGEPASLRFVSQIAAGAFHRDSLATVQFGILLLIATPVIRIAFIGIEYLAERNWLYLVVAIIVLAVLGSSLVGHKL